MNKKFPILAIVAIVILGLVSYQIYPRGPKETWTGSGAGEVAIEIPAGVNLTQIGRILADAGVVETASFFAIATYDREEAKRIQPGRYLMAKGMGSDEAIDRLLDPASRLQLRILLQEGLRLSRAMEIISKRLDVDLKLVQQAVTKLESGQLEIKLPDYANESAEGFLYPATYLFSDNVTIEEVLASMVKRYIQAERTVDLLAQAKKTRFSAREILTMASLVEAEAFPQDFGKVARTILNRLEKRMPLQFDATVNYALGTKKLLFTPAEFQIDSPYNTYRYPGLPPGPIGSPGEGALRAVLDPPNGDWIYFVSTDPAAGVTKFTSNYAEFLKFKAEFQKWYRENRR